MAASRISALVAIAGAAITATSVVPITSDFATPTTYKMTMAQLRTALFAGVSGYAASDILSIGAAAPAAGIVRLDGGTQAGAASVPIIWAVQTWNNATTVFTGLLLNVTSTLSAATSKLIDLQLGGVSQFSVTKAGALTVAGTSALQAVTATSAVINGLLSVKNLAGDTAQFTLLSQPNSSSSRDWRFATNNGTLGDLQILRSTSAGGATTTVAAAFDTNGALTLASGLTVSAGGITVSAGIATLSAGLLVIGPGSTSDTNTMVVKNASGTTLLAVGSDGQVAMYAGHVYVGTLPTSAGAAGTLYSVAGVVHVS